MSDEHEPPKPSDELAALMRTRKALREAGFNVAPRDITKRQNRTRSAKDLAEEWIMQNLPDEDEK